MSATIADGSSEREERLEHTGRHDRAPSTGSDIQTRRFEALIQLFVARMPEALR